MFTQKDIFNLYKKYNVSASKRFGQNFLYNQKILDKIVNATNINNKNIIEIGPGLGALTIKLLEKAKKVTSYEIDNDMTRVLKGEIKNEKFELIEGDFLKANLNWNNKKLIIANIPYNITSNILFKLFENNHKISEAVLMMQKEVGERLLAPVASKQYGKLTITTQLFAQSQKIVLVPPTSFVPAPKVTSIVLKLTFNNDKVSKDLIEFIKKCFSFRRKTLLNNLKGFMDITIAAKCIENFKFNLSVRPQELTKDQYIELYNFYKKNINNY